MLAAGFAAGVIAISGLPPFGAFTSEFLILTSTFAREPWLALAAGFGLLVAFGALLLCLQNVLFGTPAGPSHAVSTPSAPLIVHLSLVLIAGLYLPATLMSWFQRAAEMLG
jgi:hydrogenase-4 component F